LALPLPTGFLSESGPPQASGVLPAKFGETPTIRLLTYPPSRLANQVEFVVLIGHWFVSEN